MRPGCPFAGHLVRELNGFLVERFKESKGSMPDSAELACGSD